jgi:hypothetical protein
MNSFEREFLIDWPVAAGFGQRNCRGEDFGVRFVFLSIYDGIQ